MTTDDFDTLCRTSRVLSFDHCEAVQEPGGSWALYDYSHDGVVCLAADIPDEEIGDRGEEHDHAHSMRHRVPVRPLVQATMPVGYDPREHGIHPD